MNSDTKKELSIIIPAYNVVHYIEDCVKSIERLSLDYEVLIIDDQSTDETLRKCTDLASKNARIRVIQLEEKGGPGGACNKGIIESKSDYLIILHSDDTIDINVLEKMYKYFIENNLDVLIGGVETINEENRERKKWTTYKNKFFNVDKNISDYLYPKFGQLCPWDKIYRKELFFNEGCLFPINRFWEDTCTIPKIMMYIKRIGTFKEHFYKYLKRKTGAISSQIGKRQIVDLHYVLNDLIDWFKKYKPEFEDYIFETIIVEKFDDFYDSTKRNLDKENLLLIEDLFRNFIYRLYTVRKKQSESLKGTLDHWIVKRFVVFFEKIRNFKKIFSKK